MTTLIDRFELKSVLGEGEHGTVYHAIDTQTNANVALKRLRSNQGGFSPSLMEEFAIAKGVSHPNLVQLFGLFSDEHETFYTLELIDGSEFGEWAKDNPITESLLHQIVGAIGSLHWAGVLHQDLKPSNIMVTRAGEVKVLDFGLASVRHSRSTLIEGTPAYLAPEAFEGRYSTACDWYALGVTLYEVFAGIRPYTGSIQAIYEQKTKHAARLEDHFDNSTRDLIVMLTQPDPSLRPSGTEVAEYLGLPNSHVEAGEVSGAWPLVGRGTELERLAQIFTSAQSTPQLHIVCVTGAAGIGKSRFLEAAQQRATAEYQARCYSSVCYPDRCVALGAFQDLVVPIVGYLDNLVSEPTSLESTLFAAANVLPELANHLDWLKNVDERCDELTTTGYTAIGQLLTWSIDSHPALISIDDFEHADGDSINALLSIIENIRDLPAVLLLGSRQFPSTFIDRVKESFLSAQLHNIELQPLSQQPTSELLKHIGVDQISPSDALDVTQGNPFLVVQWALNQLRSNTDRNNSLDTIVATRIEALAEPDLAVFGLIVSADEPVPFRVLVSEFGDAAMTTISRLCAGGYTTASEAQLTVRWSHDWFRDEMRNRYSTLEWRALCLRMADRFREYGSPASSLAHQYAKANAHGQAAHYAELAADDAARSGALQAKASFLRQAVEWQEHEDGAWFRLKRDLANALKEIGLYSEAADHLIDILGKTNRVPGNLAIEIAECLMASGRIDEGLHYASNILKRMGRKFPPNDATQFPIIEQEMSAAIANEQHAKDESTNAIERADTLWVIARGLIHTLSISGTRLMAWSFEEALKASDATRACRALSFIIAGPHPLQLPPPVLDYRDRHTDSVKSPHVHALIGLEDVHHDFQGGRWTSCIRNSSFILKTLRRDIEEASWEQVVTQQSFLSPLLNLGRVKIARSFAQHWLQERTVAGDLYGQVMLRVTLMESDNMRLATEAAIAKGRWITEHWQQVNSTPMFYRSLHYAQARILQGRYDDGLRVVNRVLPAFEKTGGEAVMSAFLPLMLLSVRLDLMRALAGQDDALVNTDASLARIAGTRRADARAHAQMLSACVANHLGEKAKSRQLLEEAKQAYKHLRMNAASHACEARLCRISETDDATAIRQFTRYGYAAGYIDYFAPWPQKSAV